uniref:Uncharacterized protein n=1 Tax=Mycena chlorophos TaxID=658473 RepID=A0ABQ0L306_MYCCL|nr:predicted protein [Mycena chlorophos]
MQLPAAQAASGTTGDASSPNTALSPQALSLCDPIIIRPPTWNTKNLALRDAQHDAQEFRYWYFVVGFAIYTRRRVTANLRMPYLTQLTSSDVEALGDVYCQTFRTLAEAREAWDQWCKDRCTSGHRCGASAITNPPGAVRKTSKRASRAEGSPSAPIPPTNRVKTEEPALALSVSSTDPPKNTIRTLTTPRHARPTVASPSPIPLSAAPSPIPLAPRSSATSSSTPKVSLDSLNNELAEHLAAWGLDDDIEDGEEDIRIQNKEQAAVYKADVRRILAAHQREADRLKRNLTMEEERAIEAQVMDEVGRRFIDGRSTDYRPPQMPSPAPSPNPEPSRSFAAPTPPPPAASPHVPASSARGAPPPSYQRSHTTPSGEQEETALPFFAAGSPQRRRLFRVVVEVEEDALDAPYA